MSLELTYESCFGSVAEMRRHPFFLASDTEKAEIAGRGCNAVLTNFEA